MPEGMAKDAASEEFAQEEDRAAKLSAKASRIEASFEAEMKAERAAAQLLIQKKEIKAKQNRDETDADPRSSTCPDA